MELLLFVGGWYLSGVIGNALMLGVWWREELDVDIGDLILAAFMSLFGPVALVGGSLFAASVVIKRLTRRIGLHSDTVVWSRRA